MQVEQFLEKSAARFPDKVAVVSGSRRITYEELDRLANRLANALIQGGVRCGDRVAVCMENCIEAAVSIFGILKAGAVFVMLDHTIKSQRFEYILNDCGAVTLVLAGKKFPEVREALDSVPCLRTVYLEGAAPALSPMRYQRLHSLESVLGEAIFDGGPPAKKCIDLDLAALIYTSGTTGRPKGVMLTHLNMFSASESVISYLQNTSDDVFLNALRLSYSYGLYQVLTSFLVGARIVLERSLAYPYLLLNRIEEERVTAFPLVPMIAALLLQYDFGKHDLSSLRYVTSAGAPLPQQHVKKLRDQLPNVKIFIMYGQTECKRISYLPPDQIDIRPGSVGIAIPNEKLLIVDEFGFPVGPGVVGELIVRGSHVMKGYWGLPEESRRTLRPSALDGDIFLHTGDLFKMDDEGYLYFVSRRDDIIKTRGEKVSPKEIEDVIYSLEGVLEVAVLGTEDETLGQCIKAVVALDDGVSISAQEIRRHCMKHLEDFKVPRYIEFRTSLPKTDRGKIDRVQLQAARETTF